VTERIGDPDDRERLGMLQGIDYYPER